MSNTSAVQTENRQAIEAFAEQVLADQAQVAGILNQYMDAAVSVSLSVGPQGGGMQGWLTYARTGPGPNKIYFRATRITSYRGGAFAGGGGLPILPVLAMSRVEGRTGVFRASGHTAGVIQLWIDNVPVLIAPLPVGGWSWDLWQLEGEVKFDHAV